MYKYISRQVRLFISSTFLDMQKERDVLALQVFPRLRQLCQQRLVELTEVDLRWGVTDEQVAEAQGAIRICLEEIDLCQQHPPFFLCFLGSRYGEVKQREVFQDLYPERPNFAWLQQYSDCSITELEIVHAIFSRLERGEVTLEELAQSVHFYLRDPSYSYINTVPASERAMFVSTGERETQKLAALKARIRDSGLPVTVYQKPDELADLVFQDLWQAIERRFPESQQPTPLQQEAAEHEAFAQSRTHTYIKRPTDWQRLDDYAASHELPLVILGESGLGKSALLANWVLRYRQLHPQDLVIFHFIGCSPSSTDYLAMLRRIMGEIKARFAITADIPTEPEQLEKQLPVWFASAHDAKGRTVLILDGLNQLADKGAQLGWLPTFIPSHLRLLLSTVDDEKSGVLESSAFSLGIYPQATPSV